MNATRDFEFISYAREGKVAVVTLNRPRQGNSMSAALLRELEEAFVAAEADDSVRAVLLQAEGKNFCAGADLRDEEILEKAVDEHLRRDHWPVLSRIEQSSKPFIASVQGAAAGIGSAYAMLCDLCIMADDAYIFQAFLPIGLVPDGGASFLLGRQLGYKRAYELIVEGRKLDAQTCVDWGLVNKRVPADSLAEEALAWAQSIADKAPLAMAEAKKLLRDAYSSDYDDTFEAEARAQSRVSGSDDAREGRKAFLEKRKPAFQGR